MMKTTRRAARAAAFVVVVATVAAAIDPDVVALVRGMSLEEKVGQMTQIDVSMVTTDGKLDKPKLRHWLRKYKIGSLLNSPYSGGACGDKSVPAGWTPQDWRGFMHELQQITVDEGLPPILFGLDSVHGATYVYGATLFGHQISLAATFDRAMSREVGRITARDTLAAGVPWLFAPILGLATQPSWSRVYETFGEDPYVVAEMGVANIEGIQVDTEDPDLPTAAACMKHFFAYSHPVTGHDRAPVMIPETALREYYLLPFLAAVKRAKVRTAMESYNELNGVPIAASRKYLRQLLRDELGFEGMLVTDWAEIINLHEFHRVAPSRRAAVHLAMNNTSIDMSMVPLDESFSVDLLDLVRNSSVPVERLDESVERIMQLKKDLGLLANPVPALHSPLIPQVGGDAEVALEVARAGITLLANEEPVGYTGPKYCSPVLVNTTVGNGHDIISFHKGDTPTAEACRAECDKESSCNRWLFMKQWLLENDWAVCYLKTEEAELITGPEHESLGGYCEPGKRMLPLDRSKVSRVLLTGPTANSRVYQTGGWSIHWQGACDDEEFRDQGETLKSALVRLLPDAHITHTHGCTFSVPSHAQATCEIDADDMERTLRAARTADVAIVALGEESYTEKPGDIDDLSLHAGQLELVRKLAREYPSLSIVLVLLEGRPRLLGGITELPQVVSVLHGLLPGPAGGTALAEVILGLTNPSGRLPYTYPAFPHAFESHYSRVSSRCAGSAGAYLSTGTENCPVEYEFGHGLSYTTFDYMHLRTQPALADVTHPVRPRSMPRAPRARPRAPSPPSARRDQRAPAAHSLARRLTRGAARARAHASAHRRRTGDHHRHGRREQHGHARGAAHGAALRDAGVPHRRHGAGEAAARRLRADRAAARPDQERLVRGEHRAARARDRGPAARGGLEQVQVLLRAAEALAVDRAEHQNHAARARDRHPAQAAQPRARRREQRGRVQASLDARRGDDPAQPHAHVLLRGRRRDGRRDPREDPPRGLLANVERRQHEHDQLPHLER